MNRTGAAADRRRTEGSAPRLHIAGPGDVVATGVETVSERPSPCRPNSLWEATAELLARKELATKGAEAATQRQRARGKMTVRERLEALLDEGSFTETGMLARHRASGFGLEHHRPDTDGVVTGWGTIDGRKVFVYAHDFRIFGGSLGEVFARKIQTLMDLAAATGAPIIGLNDGGGARIQEGITALAGFGGIFTRNVNLSGVVPQISVILGPCAGGAAYSPALTDFVFSIRDKTNLFITGPEVVE
ncbi:MAG TPA: carboxyl transferase domain-containing protein, partial [Mycobacterium sp.]